MKVVVAELTGFNIGELNALFDGVGFVECRDNRVLLCKEVD